MFRLIFSKKQKKSDSSPTYRCALEMGDESLGMIKKPYVIQHKVFIKDPHMPFSLDVHKPALAGGCSQKCFHLPS